VSDIDTAVADSLKVLDLKRPGTIAIHRARPPHVLRRRRHRLLSLSPAGARCAEHVRVHEGQWMKGISFAEIRSLARHNLRVA
jgi:hypothetical protein